MSDTPLRVRIAPGFPFALRFIGLGVGVMAAGVLVTALTGGEVWDKSAHRAMTLVEMLRLAALMALGGGALWWGGGRLRRIEQRQDD